MAFKPYWSKDWRYYKTWYKDMWRYRLRRLVHLVQRQQEAGLKVPKWRQFSGQHVSLSVCIITMNAAHRIGPLLQYLKTHLASPGDELVVGVDSKTTDNTLAVCQQYADVVFEIDNPHQTCNSGLQHLVEHCRGDWIIRLDDDEFPEPHFFTWVQGLIHDGQLKPKPITHYKLPRLHISEAQYYNDTLPAALLWINDSYLYPDYQMRLFQNDPALLSFPGAVGHSSIHCGGKRGKLHGVNLVHLNLAINPRFKREAKLQTYVQRLNGGWVHPVNERALLFEDFDYAIEPYLYPDADFCRLLAKTVVDQRTIFEQAPPAKTGHSEPTPC